MESPPSLAPQIHIHELVILVQEFLRKHVSEFPNTYEAFKAEARPFCDPIHTPIRQVKSLESILNEYFEMAHQRRVREAFVSAHASAILEPELHTTLASIGQLLDDYKVLRRKHGQSGEIDTNLDVHNVFHEGAGDLSSFTAQAQPEEQSRPGSRENPPKKRRKRKRAPQRLITVGTSVVHGIGQSSAPLLDTPLESINVRSLVENRDLPQLLASHINQRLAYSGAGSTSDAPHVQSVGSMQPIASANSRAVGAGSQLVANEAQAKHDDGLSAQSPLRVGTSDPQPKSIPQSPTQRSPSDTERSNFNPSKEVGRGPVNSILSDLDKDPRFVNAVEDANVNGSPTKRSKKSPRKRENKRKSDAGSRSTDNDVHSMVQKVDVEALLQDLHG